MTRANPTCPGCGAEVQSIKLTKNFIFVDGVRHSAGWVWELACCQATMLDDELDFFTYEDEEEVEGQVLSVLVDRNHRGVAMQWIDELPQED